MNIDKPIIKAVKQKSITFDEIASEIGMSYNKLLDSIFGNRLIAPEKLSRLGEKLEMDLDDIDKLHKIHNKTNFDKRNKQAK